MPHDVSNLKHKILKGSLWSFVGTASRQGFGLLVFILLSRLLSPADFGTMAMAVAVVEILLYVVGLGLTVVVVRLPELSPRETSTAFWMNIAAGTLVGLTVFLGAGPLANALGEPSVKPLLQVLALLPFIHGFTVVQEAILQRDMAFKNLAMRTLFASSGAGVVSVAMAFAGFGVYSLVFQRISTLLIVLIALWSLSPWRPAFIFSPATARTQLSTGFSQLCSTLVNKAGLRAIDIIIGTALGAATLGFYRVAGKLSDFISQMLIEPIVGVSLSSFSKVQEDKTVLARMYRNLTQFCGLLTIPAFIGLAVLAPQITQLVFGEKWALSGQLMQIFCFVSLGSTLNYFFKPLMSALGLQKQMLRVNLLQFVLLAGGVYVAARFNIFAVMWAIVFANTAMSIINLFQVRKHVGVSLMSTVQVFAPPALSSALMAVVLFSMQPLLAAGPAFLSHPLPYLLIQIPLGMATYAICLLWVFPAYTRDMKEKILPTILKAFKGKKSKKAAEEIPAE